MNPLNLQPLPNPSSVPELSIDMSSDTTPFDSSDSLHLILGDNKPPPRPKGLFDISNIDLNRDELDVERRRAHEALVARDAMVQRLADAYALVHQKSDRITQLEREISGIQSNIAYNASTNGTVASERASHLEKANKELQDEAVKLRTALTEKENTLAKQSSATARPFNSLQGTGPEKTLTPIQLAQARHAILAALPVPPNMPRDALKPITIPAPLSLHDFLSNASGPLRSSLSNYRVFQQLTTSWCPEREEHGYLLTPVFKCSTNPRVATAHRWTPVELAQRMNKPTECFYNRDGKWYYAGVYKYFPLDDLTPAEWEELSAETTQLIVKDTLSGRKYISPQNVYETTQLYAAGALKVACIGLQCVGFNVALYNTIIEQASKYATADKVAAPPSVTTVANTAAVGAWGRMVPISEAARVNERT